MSSEEQKKQMLAQKLFRNLKSKHKSSNSITEPTVSTKKPKISTSDDGKKEKKSDLLKRAIQEINRETESAAKIAEEVGPSGWRIKSQKTNKRFLANTMRSVLSHNERTKVKHETESKRKFDELTKRPQKFGSRLHSFQSSEERMTKQKKSHSST